MMNVSLPTLIWLVQFPYRRQELWPTLWITYGIGVQANMLKLYPQIILGRFSFHLPNLLIGPNYFKITQMQENVPSEFFFFSISYFGWLHKSGKMKWSVCRHEERDIEFNFSSVSKLVWICHIFFLAKRSSASRSSNLHTDETGPEPLLYLKAAQNPTETNPDQCKSSSHEEHSMWG